eukprot:1718325-Rhodomonas_salina.2
MSNSGGQQHVRAIQAAMGSHSAVLRSLGIQVAAVHAVSALALAGTGSEGGNEEHQQLLAALSEPATHDDKFPPAPDASALHQPGNTTELWARPQRACSPYIGLGALICSGRRLPQHSIVSGTLNTYLGMGRGVDARSRCVNYAQHNLRLVRPRLHPFPLGSAHACQQ